jgi:hypothetical protein
VDGRAMVSPLFKPGQPAPGINNYYYSNKRLETCILRKLDEANLAVIDKIYESYLDMGIVEEIEDKKPWLGDAVYWPTLIVHSPKSETTPVRPCCDGKAKQINGKSINELLFLARPNQMCTLMKVLTIFRQYNVAFTGDISKMFLKILVPEEYRKFHRVIWVGPDRKTRRIFQFTGHLFGNQGSPTASMWTA